LQPTARKSALAATIHNPFGPICAIVGASLSTPEICSARRMSSNTRAQPDSRNAVFKDHSRHLHRTRRTSIVRLSAEAGVAEQREFAGRRISFSKPSAWRIGFRTGNPQIHKQPSPYYWFCTGHTGLCAPRLPTIRPQDAEEHRQIRP